MHPLDWLPIALFAAHAITSGLRARRAASVSLDEYFLAGRNLGGISAGMSMAATQFAADTPLLVTGLVATAGIFALWRLWIYALAFLLLGFVLAPAWRRARVLTDAELAELRYGSASASWLRGFKAFWFGTVFNCTVLAMVLLATAQIAEPFLHWHAWLPDALFEPARRLVEAVGVPFARGEGADVWVRSTENLISLAALVAFTTFYSATGGLRSVVRTDVAQLALMLGASVLYAAWVVGEVGGLGALVETLRVRAADGARLSGAELLAFTPDRARDASLVLLAAFGLQWLVQMNADGTGYLAQRTMACRSDRDARLAALVFTVTQVFVRSLIWLPIALGLLVLFPADAQLAGDALRAEREGTFVAGIAALPVGLRGLMLTAMLAALASTIDTHLNWGASYWTNDLYARFVAPHLLRREPSPRELVWVARGSAVAMVAVALAILPNLGSIQTAWTTSLLLGAGMGVMLVLRWVWWRVTAAGELATIAASALLAPVLLAAVPAEDEALRLLLMAVGATGAGVAVSLLGPAEPRAGLVAFYRRARPPGFWGPVARETGAEASDDARRLARGLAATALAALSVFGALVGCGTWLAGSPAPAGVPRAWWIGANLAVAAALVPVWWRLGGLARRATGPR